MLMLRLASASVVAGEAENQIELLVRRKAASAAESVSSNLDVRGGGCAARQEVAISEYYSHFKSWRYLVVMISGNVSKSSVCAQWTKFLLQLLRIGNVPFCTYHDRVVTWAVSRGKSIVSLEFAVSIDDHEKRFMALRI